MVFYQLSTDKSKLFRSGRVSGLKKVLLNFGWNFLIRKAIIRFTLSLLKKLVVFESGSLKLTNFGGIFKIKNDFIKKVFQEN